MLMHLAMVCSDDPVSSADEVILDGVGAYATLHRQSLGAYYTTLCSLIDVTELPDATLITFPGTTHVQIGGINLFAAQVMTQFVLDPTAPLDTSCVEETPVLGFVLPDGSMSQEAE